ncbi:MATE family efflux transporter DinF [Kistimonas scapharcae]|uniref:MATE family efflux transporter DinF n=1 Tax=Kistimonas scapharcae TaxID=1036133 RepID=A0ABP8V2V7_9GAMM
MNVSYRRVWQFAWPVTLSNITVPMLGLVDSAVLGHLPSTTYLGAVAIGASLFTFVFWAFGFLRMGTTGLVANASGEGDSQKVRDILVQSLVLAGGIGFILILLARPILSAAIPFYQPGPLITPELETYFLTRSLSAPAVLANYAILGWLLGVQMARAPLILLTFANAINIVLDLFLVLGLGMKTGGVAQATVVADYSTLMLGLYLIAGQLKALPGSFRFREVIRLEAMQGLLLVNRQLFVRTLCLLLAFATFTAWGSRLGDDTLAANALLLNFLMLISNALDGFAFAAESLVGKACGQRNRSTFQSVVRATGACSIIMAFGCFLIFLLFGQNILGLLTDIDGLDKMAAEYLPWLIAMPLVGVLCFWLDGVYIGMGKTGLMQNLMVLSTGLIFIPAWYLTRESGNHGLWFAFTLFMAARSVGMAAAFVPVYRNYCRTQVEPVSASER